MQSKEEWLKHLERRDKNSLVLPCDCRDLSHVIVFEIERNGSFGSVEGVFQLFLNRQLSFWKRLVVGFRYVFGIPHDGRGGMYEIDATLLNEYQLKKLRDFINEKLANNG